MNVNLIEIEALMAVMAVEEVLDPEVAHSKIGEMVTEEMATEEIATWTEEMVVHQNSMIEEGKYKSKLIINLIPDLQEIQGVHQEEDTTQVKEGADLDQEIVDHQGVMVSQEVSQEVNQEVSQEATMLAETTVIVT